MSTDITIVLSLLGRDEYTKRWVSYASYINLQHPIIVLDGGVIEGDQEKYFQSSGLNYTYYWTGHDVSPKQYLEKMIFGLSLVESEHCVLVDNDDFLLPSFFEIAVQFLNDNKAYSCCGGGMLSYYEQTKDVRVHARPLLSYESDTPLVRVESFFCSMQAIYYDVMRTNILLGAFRSALNHQIFDLFNLEYYVSFWVLINGKSKKLNKPSLIRQHDSDGSNARKLRPDGSSILEIADCNANRLFCISCASELNAILGNEKRISSAVPCRWLDMIHYEAYIKSILKVQDNSIVNLLLFIIRMIGPSARPVKYKFIARLFKLKTFRLIGLKHCYVSPDIKSWQNFLDQIH